MPDTSFWWPKEFGADEEFAPQYSRPFTLDVCAKPIFGALLLWGPRGIDPARLGLRTREVDEDPARYKKKHELDRNGHAGLGGGHAPDMAGL